jgi:DNA-binding NtrC family response regulator
VDQFAFHLIKKAIAMADGNISQAAKLLGMPRGTLRYKLEKSASLSAAAEVDSDQNGSSTRAGFLV